MKSIVDTLRLIKNAVDAFEGESGRKASTALIGGHAAIFSGVARTTLDVDLCFHSDGDEPGASFHVFLERHLPSRFRHRFMEASKDQNDPLKHGLIILDDSEDEYPRIDILVARYGWELEGLKNARQISGIAVPVMPLPHLLAMKLLAGGRKDELDVIEMLKAATAAEKDEANKLARKIGRDRMLNSLLKE